ncbi:MAG: hypothetical protein ACE3JN_06610 [Ectobacillus sp.]
MSIWNERRRLQREKRLGPARGKHPPVVAIKFNKPYKKNETIVASHSLPRL